MSVQGEGLRPDVQAGSCPVIWPCPEYKILASTDKKYLSIETLSA